MTISLRDVDTVIFDCDSTLSAIEGIDELAASKGVKEKMAPLTTAAMEGHMPLESIYGRRLELIQPTRDDIDWLAQRYITAMVGDVPYVIEQLQAAGKEIHIVSGGIYQAVAALAKHLGITGNAVHAVELYFDHHGGYRGYDENSPLGRSGGKKVVCRNIVPAGKQGVMVGDGVTDLEASQQGIQFIGFGGIVTRQQVREQAEDFITGPGLASLLDRLT